MEKIGLEGIFKTEAFAAGLSKYTSGLSSAASHTISKAGVIGQAIGGALVTGAAAFAAIGAAAIAGAGVVAGAITKMVFDAATLGDTFSQMSLVTGISTTRLQELAYAGKLLDVDLETITSGMRFLTRNMYSAKDGTGETADAFKALGINVVGADGKLRDADVVFGEAIDALGKMENPTEADAIAMKIMGRSAQDLNPLIKAGSKLLAKYSLEAHEMGAVIGEEDVEALDKFRDQMDAGKVAMTAIKATVATAFLPAFQRVADMFRKTLSDPKTQAWLKQLQGGLAAFMNTLTSGAGLIPALKNLVPLFDDLFGGFISKLPSIQEIISGIFTGGVNLTETIKTWAAGVDWSGISSSIADFISSIDWAKLGTQLRTMLSNLAKTIGTIIKETELKELFGSIGTAIGDFIAGAIVPGEDWSGAWRKQWGPTLDSLKKMITDYGWERVGIEIAGEIATALFGWLVIDIQKVFDAIKLWINENMNPNPQSPFFLPDLKGGKGAGGVTPKDVVPFPAVGAVVGAGATASAVKTINNNITVNNPAAETASTSVSATLTRLSYLGAT